MTRAFTGLCVAAAFGMVAPIAAQKPYTPPAGTTGQTSTTHSDSSKREKKNEVTVTGCLSRGADGRYILTDARSQMGSSSSSATRGTTAGTSGSAGRENHDAANAGRTWELTGGHDLDKHVGHRIRVTGHLEEPGSTGTSGTSATGTTAATGSTAGGYGQHEAMHRLDVKKVKMVSTSCS